MNNIRNINPNSSFLKGLSHFKNPDVVLPTLLIEACCTSGRTYQSYKRGGTLEAKERFREEATSAVFWLWGVKALNKIGDLIGEKILKLKDIDVSVGKDALRDPSIHMSKGTLIYKFAKIITSVVLATGLIGFAVPKINHAITARALNKRKNEETSQSAQNANIIAFADETKTKNADKYMGNELSFKGSGNLANFIAKASYNLENNNKWRLISTDTGMIAGRVANSRHPAEALEYTFRDTSSIYFYNFAAANMIFALNKLFKTPDVHPKALAATTNYLLEQLRGKNMTGEDLLKSLQKSISDSRFEKIKFDSDGTIKVRELLKQYESLGFDKKNDRKIILESIRMSHLQPKLRGERVLSKQQLEDVFSANLTSNPKFLKNAINDATYGKALNPKKFVSAKTTQSIRESIDEYCIWIAKKAGSKVIDENFIKNTYKKSIARTTMFQAAGMLFSAFGLAILIPKAQILLSQKVFGKKSFEDIATGKDSKKDGKSLPS